jgi:hypothetical protein
MSSVVLMHLMIEHQNPINNKTLLQEGSHGKTPRRKEREEE